MQKNIYIFLLHHQQKASIVSTAYFTSKSSTAVGYLIDLKYTHCLLVVFKNIGHKRISHSPRVRPLQAILW